MENSRLNKLPGELRNRIYRLVLVQNKSITFDTSSVSAFRIDIADSGAEEALSLLFTCKQIRAEALPIFFAENQFKFKTLLLITRMEADAIRHARETRLLIAGWLATIGTSARHIRRPIIDFTFGWTPKENHSGIVDLLPGLMMKFQTLFTPMKTRVVWELSIRWSRFDMETLTFWDAASARDAFNQAFGSQEGLISSAVAYFKEGVDKWKEEYEEIMRAELKQSRPMVKRFIAAVETTKWF